MYLKILIILTRNILRFRKHVDLAECVSDA